MVTLQDLKNVIQVVEDDLISKTRFSADEIPIKLDFLHEVESIELNLSDYLGDKFITIELR